MWRRMHAGEGHLPDDVAARLHPVVEDGEACVALGDPGQQHVEEGEQHVGWRRARTTRSEKPIL